MSPAPSFSKTSRRPPGVPLLLSPQNLTQRQPPSSALPPSTRAPNPELLGTQKLHHKVHYTPIQLQKRVLKWENVLKEKSMEQLKG